MRQTPLKKMLFVIITLLVLISFISGCNNNANLSNQAELVRKAEEEKEQTISENGTPN